HCVVCVARPGSLPHRRSFPTRRSSDLGFHRVDGTTEPFHLVRARIREVFGEEFRAPVIVDHHIRFAALQEAAAAGGVDRSLVNLDRKSTRLNSSHVSISYAVFCLTKKT